MQTAIVSPFGDEAGPAKMTKSIQVCQAELMRICKLNFGSDLIRSDRFFIDWTLVDVKALSRAKVREYQSFYRFQELGYEKGCKIVGVEIGFARIQPCVFHRFLVAFPAPAPEPAGPDPVDPKVQRASIDERQAAKAELMHQRRIKDKLQTKARRRERLTPSLD